MKYCIDQKCSGFFFLVFIAVWLLPNEGQSGSFCSDDEYMGVIHQTNYSQQLMKDDGPDIVTDSTTYYLPGESYSEVTGIKYVMSASTVGSLLWKKEPVKLYEWSKPSHIYSYDAVTGLAFVREKTADKTTLRPIGLIPHKKKELNKHAGINCVMSVTNTGGGKIETCSITIFGKSVDLYATIESTKTVLTTILLKEVCFSRDLHIVPDHNWK